MLLKLFVIISLSSFFIFSSAFAQSPTPNVEPNLSNIMRVVINSEGHEQVLNIPLDSILFKIVPHYNNEGISTYNTVTLDPSQQLLYSKIGFSSPNNKIAFIYPLFTQAAYMKFGFYDYYKNKCQTCLTIPIPDQIQGGYSSSYKTATILKLLNYSQITDVDIDKNPDILKNYDRIIVLHNEYVTKKEYDAIINHPNVTFLFPNALYAEVKTNYTNNTITLIRGHGYPNVEVKNGFDWKYDNSKFEYNAECTNWNFYHKSSYTLLDCYPEYKMLSDQELLIALHNNDPTDMMADISNWLRYPDEKSAAGVLNDFDLSGSHIPNWVQTVGIMTINQDISITQFGSIIDYLSEKNLIQ